MIPTYTLHKLPEGFIITSDEEIKIGEKLCTIFDDGFQYIDICTQVDKQEHLINYNGELIKWTSGKHCFKLVAQENQIDFSFLSEEEQKTIGFFDKLKLIKQFSEEGTWQCPISYEIGFYKAQELLSDRKFSLKDVTTSLQNYLEKYSIKDFGFDISDFINYLESKPYSWKVELEMERTRYPKGDDGWEDVYSPKFTNGKIKLLKLLK